jgi:diacylglycerol kinase (ATP)
VLLLSGFKDISVILNPQASGGRGARVRPKLEDALRRRDLSYSLVQTEEPGHATALAREAMDRAPDLVLVVGGDGTIHEVANGLLSREGARPPIGVIPVGTGNDFFRMVGGPKDPEKTLDALLSGTVKDFEVGEVRYNGKSSYFVNLLGLGVDVEVLRKRESYPRLKGLPQYLAALVSALWSFRPSSVRVTLGPAEGTTSGEVIDERTILVAVTVGPSVGGGFLLSPEASPYDGLLDLFFVKPLGVVKLARYIPKVIRGTHQGLPELVQRRVNSLTIERSDKVPFFFEMDGENVPDPVTRLEVVVHPGLLQVLVPGEAD